MRSPRLGPFRPNADQRPPGYPILDRDHPLCVGLRYALLDDLLLRDAVSGLLTTVAGTKASGAPVIGRGRAFGATVGAGSTDSLTTTLSAHATQRTYAIWFQARTNVGNARFFDKRVSGSQVELLSQSGANAFLYERDWSGGSPVWATPSLSLAPMTTQLVVVAYDGSSTSNVPTVQVNGDLVTVSVNSGSASGSLLTNSDAYVLGNRRNDNARVMDGLVGSFMVWDRILTPQEQWSLWNPPTRWSFIWQPTTRVFFSIPSGGTTYTRTPSGVLASTGVLARQARPHSAGTLTTAGAVVKGTAKAFAGALTTAGTLAAIKTALLALSGAVTMSGAVANRAGKAFAGALTSAGSAVKRTARTLGGALSTAGALAAIRTVLFSIAGTVTTTGSLVRQTRRSIAGTVTTVGAAVRQTTRMLTGGLATAGALTALKTALLTLLGALTASGAVVRRTMRPLSSTLVTAATTTKRTARALVGVLTVAGAVVLVKTALVLIGGMLSTAGALMRRTSMHASGALAPAGTVTRLIARTLAGGLSWLGDLATSLNGYIPAPFVVRVATVHSLSAVRAVQSLSLRRTVAGLP